ncbi:hypothetical protein JTB14_030454 [Gonioctena quinquepunctata]|nr:hypothetical protein JTB14_030454 [Gonioctena quinquepunctata]
MCQTELRGENAVQSDVNGRTSEISKKIPAPKTKEVINSVSFETAPSGVQSNISQQLDVEMSNDTGNNNNNVKTSDFIDINNDDWYTAQLQMTMTINSNKNNNANPNSNPTNKEYHQLFSPKKSKWVQVRAYMEKTETQVFKAQNITEGITIQPHFPDDSRKILHVLPVEDVSHHTFCLPENELSRVVLRVVPKEFPEEDIGRDLEDQGFTINSVSRMKKYEKTPIPMVLVPSDRSSKHIFDVRKILDVIVEAESQKP